jgi:hypothetical protein
MTKVIVHLKKRSRYQTQVIADCFIRTDAFQAETGIEGEVHVYQGRMLTPEEFNSERDAIFSSRVQARTMEVPTILMVEVADAPAPGQAKKPAAKAEPPVQSASSAAMAAAAESAEPAPAKAKPKTKE